MNGLIGPNWTIFSHAGEAFHWRNTHVVTNSKLCIQYKFRALPAEPTGGLATGALSAVLSVFAEKFIDKFYYSPARVGGEEHIRYSNNSLGARPAHFARSF